MRVTRTYCDKCKKEIECRTWYVPRYKKVIQEFCGNKRTIWVMEYDRDELCSECAMKRAEKVINVVHEKIDSLMLNQLENWIHSHYNYAVGDFYEEETEDPKEEIE